MYTIVLSLCVNMIGFVKRRFHSFAG